MALPSPVQHHGIAAIQHRGIATRACLHYFISRFSSSVQSLRFDRPLSGPHIKKYEDFRTDAASGLEINNMWLSGKNIPVLRYADVLLCYAECLNELGQTSQAETYVNQVRTRAFGGTLPAEARWSGLSQTGFREQMQDERIRELFGENWRRYDLIRTGQFLPRLKKFNKWAAQSVAAGTFKDYLQLWPIPLTELNQNTDMRIDGKFDQNEGY